MADKKIEEATRVASVDGSEILPASVGGAAKSLTTEQVKAYVLSAIAALTDATDWGSDSGDRVTVRQNGANKNIAVGDFIDVVFEALTGKTAATTLSDSDVISVKNSSEAKTTTLGAIKSYVSAAFTGNMDIHGLTAADNASATDELAAYQAGDVNANRKVTVAQVAAAVAPTVATAATTSQTAIGSTDCIIIARAASTAGENPTLEKVPLQSSGLPATSSVSGPSTTTADKIPQWNNATRGLKDGLSVVTSVGSSSADTEVPTAKATYDATKDKVTGISSSTDGEIVRFDGASGKAVKGGVSMVTSVGATGSDTAIPTEKAVRTAIGAISDACLKAGNEIAQGAIPIFSTAGNATVDAQTITKATSIRATATASDDKLATEKAVATALDVKVAKPASTTENKIPQWDATTGVLKDGLELRATTIREAQYASASAVPSEAAVRGAIDDIKGDAIIGAGTPVAGAFAVFTTNGVKTASTNTYTKTESVNASPASASNSKIPTEKAVSQRTENMVSTSATTTANKIPQWDATSKTLKDGKAVVTSIGIEPSNDNIPTEKAVSDAIDGKVNKPAITTENNIPQWDATTGTLKDGLDVSTSITSSSTDLQIPTAKAVNDRIGNGSVLVSGTTTEGNIPQWDNVANRLVNGLPLTTSVSNSSTDSQIPTAKSVNSRIIQFVGDGVVHSTPGAPSFGRNAIPVYSDTANTAIKPWWHTLDETYAGLEEDMDYIATAHGVLKTIGTLISVSNVNPGQSGAYQLGQIIFCTTDNKMYINTAPGVWKSAQFS